MRIDQLPVSAARSQHGVPDMFYNFYLVKKISKLLKTQQPLKIEKK